LQADLDAVIRLIPADRDVNVVLALCPACQGTELVDGDLRSTGQVHFKPKKTKFWTLKDSTIALAAKMCTRCGTVFLVGNTAKLNTLREPGTEAEKV